MDRLVDRDPAPDRAQLLAALVPGPQFRSARFSTYLADPGYPGQAEAVTNLRDFALSVGRTGRPRRWPWRQQCEPVVGGRYLDGGFGVGKTHLLASLWHEVPGPKFFGTFMQFTQVVGALGFAAALAQLSTARLVAIDEFELDDPGDTVLMSTLLNRLRAAGVFIATTSNTLPQALGQGRFAADDFLREIQTLARHFEVITLPGSDYRQRNFPVATDPAPAADVRRAVAAIDGAACDDFEQLAAHLGRIHPSRYHALLADVTAIGWVGLRTITDNELGLRMVTLIDRMYDLQIPLLVSGISLGELFSPELLASGYAKKYLRTSSRLVELSHAWPATLASSESS